MLRVKTYFTGKPCKRGHIANRYLSGSCCACKAEDRVVDREKKNKYFKEYRLIHPPVRDRIHDNAMSRARYSIRTEELRTKIYAWRDKNPEKVKESSRKSYYKNISKTRLKARERYLKNRESILESDRQYRLRNLEKRREMTRRWRRENPEKARVSTRNKKAMRRGAEGKHNKYHIAQLHILQNGLCNYCKIDLSKGCHVDHIMPLSRGGSNWPENLQLLCPPCNMQKHNKIPICQKSPILIK